MPIKKSEWDLHYLNQQYSAMRWLAKQGLSPDEIRVMTWGDVDDLDRSVRIRKTIHSIRVDLKSMVMMKDEYEREVQVKVTGTGHEWFFLKSRIPCGWMFTSHPPKTWRKKGSEEALFPLEVVENCCRDLLTDNNTSLLTKASLFDNIEVSKLNVTKMNTAELTREAEVVGTGAKN